MFTSKHIVGHVYHSSAGAVIDWSIFIIPAIIAVVVVVAVVAFAQKSWKKEQGMRLGEPMQLTSSVQQPQAGFCPFCGAPRLAPNAAFCSNCGRQYPTGPGTQ